MIRQVTPADADRLCDIYNHYVLNTTVSFEEQPVMAQDMAQRIQNTVPALPWLVWDQGEDLLGYSYASPWRARSAYRYAVESTIYLRPDAVGQRIGTSLYAALLDQLRQKGFHTVLGGIALPNAASVALHERFGFVQTAHLTQVGRKFDQWVDVGYWQLMLPEG